MSSAKADASANTRTILKAPKNQEEVQQKYEDANFLLKKFYMFMYEDSENLYFKHRLYRDYAIIRKEKP
tara:strand:+ start:32 stop:238 length:207 start_codon:yes stop_codon:yes gene_type:complete